MPVVKVEALEVEYRQDGAGPGRPPAVNSFFLG
jgi:hypothetical protein